MNVRAVDPARSQVILIGTPAYEDPGIHDVPVVANNIRDLAAVFTDAMLGGFDAAHCTTVPSGAGVAEVGRLLVQAAAQAQDLLLVYYSGHGLLSARRRELYLSLAGTHRDQLAFTALAFDDVRDACLESPADNRVVILDSCFSGRAVETLADTDETVLGQLQVAGTYTLASAPANRTALILPGEHHTAFTERLLRLLHNGIPQAGEMISLGDIYRHLHSQLRSEGLPVPQQRGTGTSDLLGLVRNRQARISPNSVLTTGGGANPAGRPEDGRAKPERTYPQLRASPVGETSGWLADQIAKEPIAGPEAPTWAGRDDTKKPMKGSSPRVPTGSRTDSPIGPPATVTPVRSTTPTVGQPGQGRHTRDRQTDAPVETSHGDLRPATSPLSRHAGVAPGSEGREQASPAGRARVEYEPWPQQQLGRTGSVRRFDPEQPRIVRVRIALACIAALALMTVAVVELDLPNNSAHGQAVPTATVTVKRSARPSSSISSHPLSQATTALSNATVISDMNVLLEEGSTSDPYINVVLTFSASNDGPVTITIDYFGTRNGAKISPQESVLHEGGQTAYQIGTIIPSNSYCGSTVTVVASGSGDSSQASTEPGC